MHTGTHLYDEVSEIATLGGILLDNSKLSSVLAEAYLVADDFYLPLHQWFFSAILSLHRQGSAIETHLITNHLVEAGKLNPEQAHKAIKEACICAASAVNTAEYAKVVKKWSRRRKFVSICNDLAMLGSQPDGPGIDELLSKGHNLMGDIATRKHDVLMPDELSDMMLDYLDDVANNGLPPRLTTGYGDIDNLIGGLEGGDMVLLAGLTSSGKTMLSMNIANRVAQSEPCLVPFFSMEMSKKQMWLREISQLGRIPLSNLRDSRRMSSDEWQSMLHAKGRYQKTRLVFDDTSSLTVPEISARVRVLQDRFPDYPLKMICIDYLQLIRATNEREPRIQQIDKISGELKSLAMEIDVPVLVLSQFNRTANNNPSEKPRISQLRESGKIEQDSDIVLMIHRLDLAKPDEYHEGATEVIVGKARNGRLGSAFMQFRGNICSFDEIAGELPRKISESDHLKDW